MHVSSLRVALIFALVSCLCFSACSNKAVEKETGERRIQALVVLYGQYLGQHGGQSPANAAGFRAYVKKRQDLLDQFKLTDNELFDAQANQPEIKVYYNLPSGYDGVILHQAVAVNDERWVGYSFGGFSKISEAEFQELKRPAK